MAPTASSSSSAQPLTLATILAPDLSPTATASLRTALANLSHASSFEADLWLASPSPPSTPDALDTLVDWHPSAVGVTWVVSARVSVALEQCYVEGGRTAADEARAWDAWRAARRYMDDGVGAFVGEPEAARGAFRPSSPLLSFACFARGARRETTPCGGPPVAERAVPELARASDDDVGPTCTPSRPPPPRPLQLSLPS